MSGHCVSRQPMPHSHSRRLALAAIAIAMFIGTAVGLSSGTVLAHNTLLSSDPADGATLTVAPTQITWDFGNTVPLETMTVTLIDANGARSDLTGSTHGAAGDTQVVTPLPPLQPGPVSLRWRLVGPDGHPITGRVDFTFTAPAAAAVPTTVAATATALPPDAATIPTTPPVIEDSPVDQGDGTYSTSTLTRWVLRYASYLAIMAIVGILLTAAYVWSGAGTHPMLRRILSRALLATAILGFLQLLVIASDVSGKAPWASFGSIDAATTTDAGMAFALRIALALSMWLVLFHARIAQPDVYWTAVCIPGLGLLGTWAFAGHSRSMRWSEIGVIADVAHHAAAAAWIGGLAIAGWIVIPRTKVDVMVPAVRRFSKVAATSVAVLVVTGLIQTVRLVGNPTDLFDVNHGRFLAAKVVVLAVMLVIANVNRRRVEHRLNDSAQLSRHVGGLRQAVLAEFAIGLVIVAITAAMVVSPPSSSQSGTGAPTDFNSLVYYIL